jgi:hypothetical protein
VVVVEVLGAAGGAAELADLGRRGASSKMSAGVARSKPALLFVSRLLVPLLR